jgi:hypothetical protein
MKSIVYVAIVISTFLAFALITTEKVPATSVNVLAQSESWDINETPEGGGLENDTGTTG